MTAGSTEEPPLPGRCCAPAARARRSSPTPVGGRAAAGGPAPQVEAALLEQYLLAVFNGLLLDSLLVENQQRIPHLQAALQRLDERCEALRQRRVRQEQIIEEVEVALGVAGAPPAHSPGLGAEA